MELALDGLADHEGAEEDVFQSLFSWNLLLMIEQRYDVKHMRYVSILVVGGLALDVDGQS